MQAKKKLLNLGWTAAWCMVFAGSVQAQQTIANPLIRPATLPGGGAPAAGATAAQAAVDAPSPEQAETRRQAEQRITQDDLNIRQQSLNLPVIPTPLINLFSNMQVTAHFQGAIVMRRVDNEFLPSQVSAPVANNSTGGRQQDAAAQASAAPRLISRTSGALRLRVGRTENISGYKLRAAVNGQDITVDWLSDRGAWVNVFFGALESSAGGVAQVPDDVQLQKVETSQFDYLVPALKTQTFSSPGGLSGQQGGAGGGFGSGLGGGGGGQGSNQPGFGSGFPN